MWRVEEVEMKTEALQGFLPHFGPWFPGLGFWQSPQDPFCLGELKWFLLFGTKKVLINTTAVKVS